MCRDESFHQRAGQAPVLSGRRDHIARRIFNHERRTDSFVCHGDDKPNGVCVPRREVRLKANKYRAVKTKVDGLTFDSKAEAKRYGELLLLRSAGEIFALAVHPKYELTVNGVKVGTYVADFAYMASDRLIVEDVKGVKTAVYRLKKKLMKAIHNIEITEVGVLSRKEAA